MRRRIVFSGFLSLASLLVGPPVFAFSFMTCGDVKVVWDDPFVMVQNTFSIPFGGMRESSLDNAINRWRGVRGMLDMVSKSPLPNPGSTYTIDDGRNDAVVVARADIGGNNGLTTLISDGCFLAGDMEWVEADVQVASDLVFAIPGETSLSAVLGRDTFIHEFGHAHGLLHNQSFNNMRVPQPRPKVGGPGERIDVLPDDAKGGRFLYPSLKPEINLFASAQRRATATDTILNNASGTVVSCTGGGGTLTINSTVGNNGTVNVTQTERWWLSTSSTAYGGGIQLFQWNNSTFVANTAFTRLITFTMPPLAAGTYFLFHGIDVLNVVTESRESDNSVREAIVVQVVPC